MMKTKERKEQEDKEEKERKRQERERRKEEIKRSKEGRKREKRRRKRAKWQRERTLEESEINQSLVSQRRSWNQTQVHHHGSKLNVDAAVLLDIRQASTLLIHQETNLIQYVVNAI